MEEKYNKEILLISWYATLKSQYICLYQTRAQIVTPVEDNLIWFFGGGGPRVVVSTAAFHARVRGSVPGLGGLKETSIHPRVKVSIVGSLRDREVACSASDHWFISPSYSLKIDLTLNPFKPEFTIVIFIRYKPRIAVAILDL